MLRVKKLLSVTLFSGVLTLLRIGSGFIVAKVIAVYTGPGGMAALGQMQNLITALTGVVSAPVGSGLVRYTAEHKVNGFDACAPWWRASVRWLQLLLSMTIPLVCLGSGSIALWLFNNRAYGWLVVAVSLALPLSALNTLLGSVINGQQQYKRFIILSMASVGISTCLMLGLVIAWQIKGALIAAATYSALSGLVMIVGCMRQPWFRLSYWLGAVDKKHLRGIGAYVAMAMASALCVPLSLLMLRKVLVNSVGWIHAGNWQAVYKISEVYLSVITMALTTYYLPRLSSLSGFDAIRKETWSVVRVVMPIVSLLALGIYVLRDFAIALLFTDQFRSARDLFAVQLVGDVVKILSWLFAFPMLSRGAAYWFIGTEVLFALTLPAIGWLFVEWYGVQGANLAYLVNYVLYLVFIYKVSPYFAR
jgi:PST family polysaccharide transporter